MPKKADHPPTLGKPGAGLAQFGISIYGGYFGGGIGSAFTTGNSRGAEEYAIGPAGGEICVGACRGWYAGGIASK